MKIVGDEPKRLTNIAKHGIDFADIGAEFFVTATIRSARAGRFAAIQEMDGAVAVIFAMLGEQGISIISARPASRKKRRLMK